MNQENTIDLSYLEQLRSMRGGGGTDIVQTVIRIFLANSPGILDSIGQFMKDGDFGQAARMAHKLKSSSANIGARQLVTLLDRFEFWDEKNEKEDRNGLFKSIQEECKNIQAILVTKLDP